MTAIDWAVVVGYLLAVLILGIMVGRTRREGRDEMLLAGRSIPTWAATLSLVATIQSAATFVGGPEMVFRNDLRHLMRITGSIMGALIVAQWMLPALYRTGEATVYGILEDRFGRGARRGASAVFLVGILLAAGARLVIAGIAFATILFGEMHVRTVLLTVLIIGGVGTIYTATGGLRAVVWTDVMQAGIYIGAAVGCLVTLVLLIPVSWSETWEILKTGGTTGHSKIQLLDTTWSWTSDDTFWASLFGLTVFHTGSFSTQQDVSQRLLACRNAGEARRALLRGVAIIFVTSWLFASIGLLLFVFYQTMNLPVVDSREVYPNFIIHYLPVGLRGLVAAGILAAAMSSIDSVINSVATCLMTDFSGGDRVVEATGTERSSPSLRTYRVLSTGTGVLLIAMACVLGIMQLRSDRELFDYAVMASFFGISGLLGVMLTALFTKRGNTATALIGLLAGGAAVGLCAMLPNLSMRWGLAWQLGFPWWIVIGVATSFAICAAGRPPRVVLA